MKITIKILTAFLAVITAFTGLAKISRAESIADLKPAEVPILMYHFLVENKGEHHISPDEFERDLIFLQKNGYTTIGISELIAFVYDNKPLPPKPVMLTFDDGYYNNYYHGFPLLQQYQSKAVISIIGDHTDIWSGNFYEDMQNGHMTWEQIREMTDSGLVEIGNHTYSMHQNKGGRKGCMRKEGEELMDYQRLFGRDVNHLQERILSECGFTPDSFAFPYHAVCDDALQVLRILGFRAAFTGSANGGKPNTITPGDTDCLFDLRRVNRSRFRTAESILTNHSN
ncbi:MAG: polysaccharide deacetylase family protein [Oscillospiraceae bacterium]|nr:polysaccharide deacetylase family protein [Oscillospiraceae bacterium]